MEEGYVFLPLDGVKRTDIVRALGGAVSYRQHKRADVVCAEGSALSIQPAKTQPVEQPRAKAATEGDANAVAKAAPDRPEKALEAEASRVIMFPERKPPEKPVKVQATISTEPIAKEINKLATIMRVTLQAQAETINKMAAEKTDRGTAIEVWEFEVVDRDQFGRIARIRTQRSSEPCR